MNITFIVILTHFLQAHYVFDPGDVGEDLQVKKLAFDLRNIEMVMAGVLTPEKLRYIVHVPLMFNYAFLTNPLLHRYLFDGLGHLVASIFIGSTVYMRQINTNGIKKM